MVLSHATFLSVALWSSRVQCGAAATALTVLEETATIQYGQSHDFVFAVQSGMRYDVRVRVGEGSGGSVPCNDAFEAQYGAGACERFLSTGDSCAWDYCATCRMRHECDRTCGFVCTEGGVTNAGLWVLPPGATDDSQAIAFQVLATADKGLGFTAAATGDFTAQVKAFEGAGPVTLTVTAVGTAEHRSPPLRADGRPHPLEVSCRLNDCTFYYDGASVYDGDGSGFDLVRDRCTDSCDLQL